MKDIKNGGFITFLVMVGVGILVIFSGCIKESPPSTTSSITTPMVAATSTETVTITPTNSGAPSVSLFQPKAGEKVRCVRGDDGIYRFSVRGTSSGTNGFRLLLWVRPVSPRSETPGWYLQRPPANGISSVEADGSWAGIAQIGNLQWPPHEGDILDLIVTIADSDSANQLMAEAGVVVRYQPVGVVSDTASNVVVTLN